MERAVTVMDTTSVRVPSQNELEFASDIMKLVSDHTRLAILALLREHEFAVGEIAAALDRPAPAISQHLAKLKSGRLVSSRREGTSVHYRLPNEHVHALIDNLLQHSEHILYLEPPHHRIASPTRPAPAIDPPATWA